jgi:predicted MFS family arabinose efflux permease
MTVLMWAEIAIAGVSLALAVLWATGALTPWLIVGLMACLGALSGLALPARLSMASWLAPPDLLPSALAINSTGFNLARFLGPAVAAAMIAAGWLGAVYLVTTLTTLAFAVALWRLQGTPRQSPARPPLPPATTWEVFRAVAATPVVAGVIGLQFAQGLLIRPASELFPAFAEEVFARGAEGLGALNACLGIGAIVGALILSGARAPAAALRQILTHSLIFAVSLLAFVATQSFWLALVILLVHGMAMSASNIAALAFVQLNTPQERLGRVLSLYTIVFRVSPALGALAFGLLAEAAGLRVSGLVLGGLGLIATLGLAVYVTRPGAIERVMQ